MQALFSENGRHSSYTRTLSDPGGENSIVMFKSSFPNSALEGNPNDPPGTYPADLFDAPHPCRMIHLKDRPSKIFLSALLLWLSMLACTLGQALLQTASPPAPVTAGKGAVLFAGTKSMGEKYWYGYIHPAGPDRVCVDAEVADFITCRDANSAPCPPQDFSGCCNESSGGWASMHGWWSNRFDTQFIFYKSCRPRPRGCRGDGSLTTATLRRAGHG